ncbi:hypothetical protein PANA5342_0637 [Pantoea ananatis LMG 5342]|nr:hypothetical protein PANA5342_0637 [Pantoea ananatis LMG 5342]
MLRQPRPESAFDPESALLRASPRALTALALHLIATIRFWLDDCKNEPHQAKS